MSIHSVIHRRYKTFELGLKKAATEHQGQKFVEFDQNCEQQAGSASERAASAASESVRLGDEEDATAEQSFGSDQNMPTQKVNDTARSPNFLSSEFVTDPSNPTHLLLGGEPSIKMEISKYAALVNNNKRHSTFVINLLKNFFFH